MNDMRDATSKTVRIIADEIQALSHEHHNYAFMLRGFADQHDYHMQRADALQRVIDEARGQEPVAEVKRAPFGPGLYLDWRIPLVEGMKVFAAPVPAQPSAVAQQTENLGSQCIDGGVCHHDCTERCFRRECCEPLSGYAGAWKYPVAQPAPASDGDPLFVAFKDGKVVAADKDDEVIHYWIASGGKYDEILEMRPVRKAWGK